MQPIARTFILRLDAAFLTLAGAAGLSSDLLGAFLGQGPMAAVLEDAPYAAIGAVEAHGLALIIATLLWRAPSSASWHATAASVHLLLGAANVLFWEMFVATETLVMGYFTTALHALFALAQGASAIAYLRPKRTTSSSEGHDL